MFKNDNATRLKIVDMIKDMIEFQGKRKAVLDTDARDDMIYSIPGAMCITMKSGKPESVGATFAPAMPGGLSFHNGNGTKAVWKRRHLVIAEEMRAAEECIAMLAKELVKA